MNKGEENLPVTKIDVSGLSEQLAQKLPSRTDVPVETAVPEIAKKRGFIRRRIFPLVTMAGVFSAGVYVGTNHPGLVGEIEAKFKKLETAPDQKQANAAASPSAGPGKAPVPEAASQEPEITDSNELLRQLRKYNYLISPELFPEAKYVSAMVLKPENKMLVGFAWQAVGKIQKIGNQNVIAVKLTNPELHGLLEEKGIKAKAKASLNGVDYYYYDCANPPQNQASIALRDPSTKRERFLDVINLILESCKDPQNK